MTIKFQPLKVFSIVVYGYTRILWLIWLWWFLFYFFSRLLIWKFVSSCNIIQEINETAKSIAILKENPISTSMEMKSEVIQNSFGHSKVVLPSGIVGIVLLRWDVSVDVHHYTESKLKFTFSKKVWPNLFLTLDLLHRFNISSPNKTLKTMTILYNFKPTWGKNCSASAIHRISN